MGNTNIDFCCLHPITNGNLEIITGKNPISRLSKIPTENDVQSQEQNNPNDNNNNINKLNQDSMKNETPSSAKNNLKNILHSNANEEIVYKDIKEYLSKIERVYNQATKLQLTVINSPTIPKGTSIMINPFGMENSLREERDGHTFFGFYENNICLNKEQSIDFIIKPKEELYEQKYTGRHFQIRFSPEDLSYYIKDLGHGYGTFKRISEPQLIKDNNLVNIGEAYLVFTLDSEEVLLSDGKNAMSSDTNSVNIKIFTGKESYDPVQFVPSNKTRIFIGRDTECDIMINDLLLSRIHCTIEFQHDKGWYLHDGVREESESKPSTNGTWLFLMEESKLTDEMIFKGNQNLYQCRLCQNR